MQIETPAFHHIPDRISRLGELAYNLWWSWDASAREMFQKLDRRLWQNTSQNVVRMLHEASPETLEKAAESEKFLQLYDSVLSRFDQYMSTTETWYNREFPERHDELMAYFCAEFAVHTSVPIYSGGLGLLAGDTCKEASDLGLPFVALGAFYPEGYFHQKLDADGTQSASYEEIQIEQTPLQAVLNDDGSRMIVSVPLDGLQLKVAIWRLQVGRVPIYLMDSDIPQNDPWNRDLVARLYGGDTQIRLRQEIVLGMGGVRTLRQLGYQPTIFHLNEGHAAFAVLELIQEGRNEGLSLEESRARAREKLVFTTHTPVKAGHDEFPFHMMEEHFQSYWEANKISREDFLQLGTPEGGHNFSMTVLALKTARKTNGVSRRHGEVSREMWSFLYPDRPVEEVPIGHITNGVHVPTWLSREMVQLFDRYLDGDWRRLHDRKEAWERVWDIPDEELWGIHQILKSRLHNFMRQRARRGWMDREDSPGQIVAAGTLLNPDTLTLGFARRFATYKRATLILRDRERLKKILLNPWQPVQLIFAGKAHPADEPGKYFLRQVYEVCSSPEFGGRVAFVENFDKRVAHYLVRGVDVWLNNPEPPKEASGTSGQKASLHGVLNLSVLDGWWCEGFNEKNGWAIEGETDDEAAASIYRTLEEEIVPRFYSRNEQDIPQEWIRGMKEAIFSNASQFSARRMMKEYVNRLYLEREDRSED